MTELEKAEQELKEAKANCPAHGGPLPWWKRLFDSERKQLERMDRCTRAHIRHGEAHRAVLAKR